MDFIDLRTQYEHIRDDVRRRVDAVLAHGRFVNGPEIPELESRLAAVCGTRYCVCCASGTDALLMALMAQGVGPGDAVFTPAFSFVAAAEVTALLGATPVFVDIGPATFLMDPTSLEHAMDTVARVRGRKRLRPAAVIPVDLFGLPADYKALGAVAARRRAAVIADAAQAFGASRAGGMAGALAPVSVTSFYPAKPLGAYGEGGAVFCQTSRMAETLRSIREHGMGAHRYEHVRLGLNARMHTLQAAVLLAKLGVFEEEVARRQDVARRYRLGLAGVVETPVVPDGCTSVWSQYTIQSDRRDAIAAALARQGIPTAIHYPKALHLQPAFSGLRLRRGAFPNAERASRRVLSLPMHPYLRSEEQRRVIDAVKAAVGKK